MTVATVNSLTVAYDLRRVFVFFHFNRFRMNQEGAQACCAVCSSKTVRRCSRCLSINYCNKEHQRQDWKRHKPECIPKTEKQGSSNNKNGEASTSSTDVTRIRDSLDRLASGASSEPEAREPGSATSDTRRLKKRRIKLT